MELLLLSVNEVSGLESSEVMVFFPGEVKVDEW